MASTQIALLRGINVGRAKRIAMADLRAIVEELGFQNVRTLLNSGNVVFTSPGKGKGDSGPKIQEAIAAKLGVSSRVTVITAAELAVAIAENPVLEVANDHSRLLVSVLATAADRKKLEPLSQQNWTPEVLGLGTRVAYLWCANGILESRMAVAVGRALGDGGTSRNWATILKLKAMAEEG